MHAVLIEAVGGAAGLLTTVAFLPQVVRTWSTKSAGDFSFAMLGIFASGLALWFAYGLMIASWPVIGANGVTLGLVLIILTLKITETRRLLAAEHALAPHEIGPNLDGGNV
jgi:MtN3 and saliva related transmembrane protein